MHVKLNTWLLSCLLLFCSSLAIGASEAEDGFGDLSLAEQWSGDFNGMVKRRVIRVLVVHNKMLYFLDNGQHRGINVDLLGAFEKHINQKRKAGVLQTKVLFLPVQRDQLLPALAEGRGDIAAANLTITPQRKGVVAFSTPLLKGVKEIVIGGPGAPPLKTIEDLAGKELYLRPSSSYYQHVTQLNERFKTKGLKPIQVVPADEFLEDSDLLEMVNTGLIPLVVVDDHKARFWAEVFDKITLYPDIAVHEGGEIGWAFRKKSPQLAKELKEFLKTVKKGTLLGNIVFSYSVLS